MPNVSLTPQMERDISQAIEAGEYTSVSEIVREGLRLWKQSRARESLAVRLLAAEIEHEVPILGRSRAGVLLG